MFNLKQFLKEKKRLVSLFSIITGFTILFSIFFANQSSFFKASLLNVFENQLVDGEGYDVFMGSYTGITAQGGSVRFFAGKDLNNVQMLSFELSYNPDEIMIKQDIEGLFGYFDFQDIKVDQDFGKSTITLMSSDPVNIPKNTSFVKIETFIKKLSANSQIDIKVGKIQFIDDSMKMFGGIGKKGYLKIGDADISPSDDSKILSISKNYCETTAGCEIKFFGNNIENFSGSIAGEKFSLDAENKITFDFTGKKEGLYDAFVSSGGNILKLENAIYLANHNEDLGTNLNSEITILSDKSYTIPKKVLNNNKMPIDLWVQVDSPNGVNLINKVTANLSVLGGSPVAQMEKAQIVDNKVWYVLKGIKIFQTVPIGEHAVEITAEDTEGNTATGNIVVNVTNDLLISATPTLSNTSVVFNKTTKQLDVFVKVSDDDGINDISSVNVDLTSLGLGYKELFALSNVTENSNVGTDNQQNFGVLDSGQVFSDSTGGEQTVNNSIFSGRTEKKTEIFRLQSPIEIPSDVKKGEYNITFTALDKSGEEATLTYNYSHNAGSAPQFVRKVDSVDDDYDMDYVRLSRRKIPNDYTTIFNISTIVKDEDGANDIVEVRADLTGIGGDVVRLEKMGDDVESSNVKSAIYNLKGIRIPSTVKVGWHEFQLVAYDKQGNETAKTIEIKVLDPSSKELENSKDTIKINSEKGYNEPNLAINDGKTTFSMNVYVENQGHEIEDVILNFGNIAKYIGGEENSSSENCKNQNDRIVCMKHSVKEGSKGQWFRLDNIVIPESTKPSTERYRIKTIAIQSGGRSVEGYSYITVSDGTLPEEGLGSPKLQMAISLSSNEVQLVFTNPLDRKSIDKNAFIIANENNDKDRLVIKDLKINTNATIVTLETKDQEPGKKYTVIANTEKLGLKEDSFTDNHKIFYGFDKEKIAPHLINIENLSDTKIALTFDQGIMPSSLEQKGKNFKIFEKNNPSKTLKVLAKEFSGDDNKTIYISTEKQVRNKKYAILIKNIQSAAGVRFGDLKEDLKYSKGQYYGIIKEFTGFNDIEEMHASAEKKSIFELSNSVQDNCIDFRDFTMFAKDYKNGVPSSEFFDYNFDNKVDFTDFTIFSKQYGKCEEIKKEVEPVEKPISGTASTVVDDKNALEFDENNDGKNKDTGDLTDAELELLK